MASGVCSIKASFFRSLNRTTPPSVCVQRLAGLRSVRAASSAADSRFSEKYCLDLVRSVLAANYAKLKHDSTLRWKTARLEFKFRTSRPVFSIYIFQLVYSYCSVVMVWAYLQHVLSWYFLNKILIYVYIGSLQLSRCIVLLRTNVWKF